MCEYFCKNGTMYEFLRNKFIIRVFRIRNKKHLKCAKIEPMFFGGDKMSTQKNESLKQSLETVIRRIEILRKQKAYTCKELAERSGSTCGGSIAGGKILFTKYGLKSCSESAGRLELTYWICSLNCRKASARKPILRPYRRQSQNCGPCNGKPSRKRQCGRTNKGR